MLYEISGLKQEWEESTSVHLLIENESPKALRDDLQSLWILILDIKEFLWDPAERGVFSLQAQAKIAYHIISANADAFSACVELFKLGFEVMSLDTVHPSMDSATVQKIIEDARQEVIISKKQKSEQVASQKKQSKKVYEDRDLEHLHKVLDDIFAYLKLLYPKIETLILDDRVRRLQQLEEQLRKLKMWRNPTKTKEVLIIFFALLDKVAEEYFVYLKNNNLFAEPIFAWSQIVERDLILEYHKLMQAQVIKSLWLPQNASDKYYNFTEAPGVFLKFIKRDLAQWLWQHRVRGYRVFDVLQFVLIVLCVELGVWLWGNSLLNSSANTEHVFVILMHVGIGAFWLFLMSIWRKYHKTNSILLLFIAVLLYFASSRLIVSYFAL